MKTDSLLFPFLVAVANFGVTAGQNACYISSLELFPTLFSGTAFGLCNFIARLCTLFASQFAEMQS